MRFPPNSPILRDVRAFLELLGWSNVQLSTLHSNGKNKLSHLMLKTFCQWEYMKTFHLWWLHISTQTFAAPTFPVKFCLCVGHISAFYVKFVVKWYKESFTQKKQDSPLENGYNLCDCLKKMYFLSCFMYGCTNCVWRLCGISCLTVLGSKQLELWKYIKFEMSLSTANNTVVWNWEPNFRFSIILKQVPNCFRTKQRLL